jgi:isoleucyl-tRNA synthetase
VLHRCLCKWLAPVLVFTAEEAWLARFADEEGSVHLLDFMFVPEGWKDEALAAKWARIRELRGVVTAELEKARAAGTIGSSLQAKPTLFAPGEDHALLTPELWAEVCIVSDFTLLDDGAEGSVADAEAAVPKAVFYPAPGTKCARCWRVLPEVGASAKHPTLCLRCEDAVEALT